MGRERDRSLSGPLITCNVMARDPRVAYAQFAQLRKINKFVREQNVGYVGYVGFVGFLPYLRGRAGGWPSTHVRARRGGPPNHTWEAGCKNRQNRQKRHSIRGLLSGF